MDLRNCPFCGGEAEFERMGDRRQSCIVSCTDCGCTLQSNEEGDRNGSLWNTRFNDDTYELEPLNQKFLLKQDYIGGSIKLCPL